MFELQPRLRHGCRSEKSASFMIQYEIGSGEVEHMQALYVQLLSHVLKSSLCCDGNVWCTSIQ
jgi:hypothetical protein